MISTRTPHYQNLRPACRHQSAPVGPWPVGPWYATLRRHYDPDSLTYNCHQEIILSQNPETANAHILIPDAWYGVVRHGNPVLAVGSVLLKAAGQDQYTVLDTMLRPNVPDVFRQFLNNTPSDIYDQQDAVANNAKIYDASARFNLPPAPEKLLDDANKVKRCVDGGSIQLRRERNIEGRSPLELLIAD